jgi:diguanylate cyclase (GGDEF)-like protein
LQYYEQHIIWLDNIADALLQSDTALLPALNTKVCAFGQWLHSEGKHVISNNSKFSAINKLHDTLHAYMHQILILLPYNGDKFHLTLTFLEKMEMLSLEIGTELALIDSSMLIAKAAKDPLTGVLNRSLFDQLFFNQYEIAQATERSFILAMCDLDHFKVINDTYGHLAGDLLLKHFANIVKKVLRSSDIVIRYGGEEFVIILPALTAEQGASVLDKVRLEFQNSSVSYNDTCINATVSIGMTVVPSDETNITNLQECINTYIDRADTQLYKAKKEGRNRVK